MPNIRVLAIVSRGTHGPHVELTNTEVWEHEVPILEEVHGKDSVRIIRDDDELLDDQDPKSRAKAIEVIKAARGLGAVFRGSPKEEWDRCELKFGLHPDVNMSVAAKVYGDYKSRIWIDALKNGHHPTDAMIGEPDDIGEEASKKRAA